MNLSNEGTLIKQFASAVILLAICTSCNGVKELGVPSTYPAGYHGDVYAAVSTDEGHNWKELGAVLIRESNCREEAKKNGQSMHPEPLIFGTSWYITTCLPFVSILA